MSEQTPQDPTRAHVPAIDPDGDPDNLNPREGDQASGGVDPGTDPDGDPDMLNPRHGREASAEGV